MGSLNLMKLAEGPYRSRAQLVQSVLPEIHTSTIQFVEEEYPQREMLESALFFSAYSLADTPSAEIKSLQRLGFFPWTEASWEIDRAFTHALCANYKATYDSARRALELSVVAAFFLRSDGTKADSEAWLRSDAPTPFFSDAIKKRLVKTDRWKALAATGWPQPLKDIYWRLSDVAHVRGEKCAAQTVQPFSAVIGQHHVARFDPTACGAALDALVEAIRQMAVVLVLTNPTMIVGLPVDEKFGLNPPASGLLNKGQVSLLRSLIHDEFLAPLDKLAAEDPDSSAMIEWVRGLPDLTEAEFEEQAEQFDKRFPGAGASVS